ncbi:PREDICTED: N-acetyltransferase 8-like [Nanorana parkeri]|uniref:N-acetyltransferase 8-like n=1 Tax=Nanorana parkeri TaxID=125878 RepID=UPI0008546578|nr:PREDICTED: N-acetyltransferase 8-like [Nanorana parkeri]
MPDYVIRLYKDSDYEAVRDIFSRGIKEHTKTAFLHTLSLPYIWALLLALFLFLRQTTGSYLLLAMVMPLGVAALWLLNRHVYAGYVQNSLTNDMMNIRKYYLERDGYCFWVAELAGEIVGMVAAIVPENPTGENQVELKRLSVPIKHRGKGIAKALCRTVIDYAWKRGSSAVVLSTSMAQIDASQLYLKMGFRRTITEHAPFILAKFIDFRILAFQYDFPKYR